MTDEARHELQQVLAAALDRKTSYIRDMEQYYAGGPDTYWDPVDLGSVLNSFRTPGAAVAFSMAITHYAGVANFWNILRTPTNPTVLAALLAYADQTIIDPLVDSCGITTTPYSFG